MTNFDISKPNNYENRLVYNFPKVNINKNEITTNSDNTQMEMTFFNGTPDPNIIYTVDGTNVVYKHKKAYFNELIHNNITGLTNETPADYGELILEHSAPGSGTPIYVCFLLEYNSSPDNVNDIDKMIGFSGQTAHIHAGIVLNDFITPQSGCISYESTKDNVKSTVFVFTTPIPINSVSKEIIQNCTSAEEKFLAYPAGTGDYLVLPTTSISLPDPDQIYINCNPTGESSDTVSNYLYPVDSAGGAEQDARSAMYTMHLFAVFMMVSVGVVAFVPGIYQMTLLTWALSADEIKRAKTLIILGWRFLILFVVISVGLFVAGLAGKDEWLIFIGSAFLYITAAGTWLLYLKKKEPDFLKIGDNRITLTEITGAEIGWAETIGLANLTSISGLGLFN